MSNPIDPPTWSLRPELRTLAWPWDREDWNFPPATRMLRAPLRTLSDVKARDVKARDARGGS
jgi:hypothetical protein